MSIDTQASTVQPSLSPIYANISVSQLFNAPINNNAAVNTPLVNDPSLRPTGMSTPAKAIHLGTNTDIFAIGTPSNYSEYWIRYTLHPSSALTSIPNPANWPAQSTTTYPIAGELWLVYRNDWLGLNASKAIGNFDHSAGYAGFNTSAFQTAQQTITGPSQFVYFACDPTSQVGCESQATLNLSFLQLKNGGLYTSRTGFDMVYFEHAKEGETVNLQMNIAYAAPVPLPPALLLLCSGLAGTAGFSRYTKRVG